MIIAVIVMAWYCLLDLSCSINDNSALAIFLSAVCADSVLLCVSVSYCNVLQNLVQHVR